ncbi:MAG: helix-turn-helix transcriptional regulator [Oscillibacter sp.]|nr:helix-turn-helix transcriptional regulator [Oscillibacter sp.]
MNDRMKQAREAANLSQKQVALTLGVSAPTVSNWEAGKINPTVANLKELCHLYKVSADYLLELQDRPSLSFAETRNQDAITTGEASLLQDFRELNEEGQEKILDFADDLIQSGKYKNASAAFVGAASA